MPKVDLGAPSLIHSVKHFAKLAADVGASYSNAAARKTPVGWATFVAESLVAVQEFAAERGSGKGRYPWRYFEEGGEGHGSWKPVPVELAPYIIESVAAATPVLPYWDSNPENFMLVEASLGAEKIRWIQDGAKASTPYGHCYYKVGRELQVYSLISEKVWSDLRSDAAVYTTAGLKADDFDVGDCRKTTDIERLLLRVKSFLTTEKTRAYLLVGPPGAGKTTAIRIITHSLGLRSLRVSVDSLSNNEDGVPATSLSPGLRAAVRMLRPDILVIDDIDRIKASADFLNFLENVRPYVKIILASANCSATLMGAALRPGRFDDIIEYETIDPSLLSKFAGGDEEIAARLKLLPVAYASDFHSRVQVLGKDVALAELTELEERAKKIEKASDGDEEDEEDE